MFAASGPATSSPGFITKREPPTAPMRLFCLPPAGSGAHMFQRWSEELGPAIDTLPVALPGRFPREADTPYRRIESLVEDLTIALAPLCDRPYAVFGHGLGALLAFEWAREARRRRVGPPARLLLSGHPPPTALEDPTRHRPLPDHNFVEALSAPDGMPHQAIADPDYMRAFLELLARDLELCRSYRYTPEPPLDAPITCFAGEGDPAAPPGEMTGWRRETIGDFALHALPGGSSFLSVSETSLLTLLHAELRAAA
jgi:surfactin synthase thioesterase subunit